MLLIYAADVRSEVVGLDHCLCATLVCFNGHLNKTFDVDGRLGFNFTKKHQQVLGQHQNLRTSFTIVAETHIVHSVSQRLNMHMV